MKRLLALFPLFLMATGCNQGPPAGDPAEITSRSDAWEAALNAADIDALVALYTTDARVLAPNGKIKSGSAGVRAEFGAIIDAGLGTEITTIEATVSGDMGYHVGTFTVLDGDTQVDAGKFIETWRRGDDGQWRISNDIYNSDMPAAAEAAATKAPETHLMISHEVEDADHWMAAWRGKDSRHKLFMDNGAAHVHTFRSADNPNLTGLVIAVTDMDAINAMLASEEGQAAAAEDGVRMDTLNVLPEAQ